MIWSLQLGNWLLEGKPEYEHTLTLEAIQAYAKSAYQVNGFYDEFKGKQGTESDLKKAQVNANQAGPSELVHKSKKRKFQPKRKTGGNSNNRSITCHYCTKNGHREDDCSIKKCAAEARKACWRL